MAVAPSPLWGEGWGEGPRRILPQGHDQPPCLAPIWRDHRRARQQQFDIGAQHRLIGERRAVNLDANCGWTREEAWTFMRHLTPGNIEYIEDPCARLEDIRALVEDTNASIRDISNDLRPPILDYAGLCAAADHPR